MNYYGVAIDVLGARPKKYMNRVSNEHSNDFGVRHDSQARAVVEASDRPRGTFSSPENHM